MTMEQASMYLRFPPGMSDPDFWLHLYVMISRVRSSAGILAFDIPSRRFFGHGPPDWVVTGSRPLEQMAILTRGIVQEAREALGWDASAEGPDAEESPLPESIQLPDGMQQDNFLAESDGKHDLSIDFVSGDMSFDIAPAKKTSRASKAPSPGDADMLQSDKVHLQSSTELLDGPQRRAVYHHCYGPPHDDFGVSSVCGSAEAVFPNADGDNACFVNASLQCLLRLEAPVAFLQKHARIHKEGSTEACAACLLASSAHALRCGGSISSDAVVAAVRRGLFGRKFVSGVNDPGDAGRLLLGISGSDAQAAQCGFLGVLDTWEKEQAHSDQNSSPSVMSRFITGFVCRSRLFCSRCKQAADSLSTETHLRVDIPQAGVVELQELLNSWRSVHHAHAKAPACPFACRGVLKTKVWQRRYMETEPTVLSIMIPRNVQGLKPTTHVCWPETLQRRSGLYHFASALLHQGDLGDGHFTAICWLGEARYAEYDDGSVMGMSWEDIQCARVRSTVYVLLFVRQDYKDGTPQDGSVHGDFSVDIVSDQIAGTMQAWWLPQEEAKPHHGLGELKPLLQAGDTLEEALCWSAEDIAQHFPAHPLFCNLDELILARIEPQVKLYERAMWFQKEAAERPIEQLLFHMWQWEDYGFYRVLNARTRGEATNDSVAVLASWLRRTVDVRSQDISLKYARVWRATLLASVPKVGDVLREPWLATTWGREVATRRANQLGSNCGALVVVLLEISTSNLRGVQLPEGAGDEKEILCLPDSRLRVHELDMTGPQPCAKVSLCETTLGRTPEADRASDAPEGLPRSKKMRSTSCGAAPPPEPSIAAGSSDELPPRKKMRSTLPEVAASTTLEVPPSKRLRSTGLIAPASSDNLYACLAINDSSLDSLSKQAHNSTAWKFMFAAAVGARTGMTFNATAVKRLRKLIWLQTRHLLLSKKVVQMVHPVPRTQIFHTLHVKPPATRRCKVTVLERDMLEVAQEYSRQGHKVAVLNMANETSPGGGVQNGAGAQEEDLHRRSDCCRFLLEQRKGNYPIPSDACLLSVQVTVFRGTEFNGYPLLDEPFCVSVVSCAAINRPKLSGDDYAMTSQRALMQRKIELILEGACHLGCDVAILSAFGCGAFGNPPGAVATMFREALCKANLAQAVFCIYDDHNTGASHNPHGNFRPFDDILRKPSPNCPDKRPLEGTMQSGSSSSSSSSSRRRRVEDVMPSVEVWATEGFPGGIQGDQSGIDPQQVLAEPGSVLLSDVPWPRSNKGFRNQGNDCWMVSAVQLLVSAPRFRDLVVSRDRLLTPRIEALRADFHALRAGPVPPCQCARMRDRFDFRHARYAGQEDAVEGVWAILDAMDSSPEPSPIAGSALFTPRRSSVYDIFGVCSEIRRGCYACKFVSHSWAEQLLCMVPTPPPPSRHTTTAIWADNYGSIEFLPDARCDCGLRGQTCRRESLKRVGDILLLQLAVYDMDDPSLRKLADARIVASPQIVLRSQGATSFKLIAAIEHVGDSLRSGHYIAYRLETSGMWRVLNDDGKTSLGLRHGSLMSQSQLDQRQLYCCMYARHDTLPSSAARATSRHTSSSSGQPSTAFAAATSSGRVGSTARVLD